MIGEAVGSSDAFEISRWLRAVVVGCRYDDDWLLI